MNFVELVAIVLALVAGFAAAVWTILTLGAWRARQWGTFTATVQLAIVNVVAAVIIIIRLLRAGIVLPPGLGTLLVTPLILLPAVLALRDWLRAQRLRVNLHD